MKKKPLLFKFLISYALILSLPIIAILAYYYPYSTNVVKEKANEWNYHVTEQLMNSMNIFTKYAYNLPAELLQNREIKPYMTDDNPYQKIIITNEMRKYNITDAFIENTLLYLNDIDYFFSKTGSAYTLDDFAAKGVGYVYPTWSVKEIYYDLNHLERPVIRPVERVLVPGGHNVNLLSFVLPLPLGGANSPGALIILVRESTILNMMQSSNDKYNGTFLIVDDLQRCLVSTVSCEQIMNSDFNQLLELDYSDIPQEIKFDGEQYLIAHTVSDMNQWHYIRLLPVSETIQDIRIIQFKTLLLLFSILGLTSLIIYFSLRYNYQPIKQLVEFSSKLFDVDGKSSLDEIDTIHYALNQLSTTKEQLNEQINSTRPKIRDHILFELVIGNYDDWQCFSQDAKPYHILLPHDHIAVAILATSNHADSDSILQYCRKHFTVGHDSIIAYAIKSLYNNEIILIFSYVEVLSLQSYLITLQQELLENKQQQSLIGVSLTLSKEPIKNFHHAYLQASRSLEQIRFQRNVTISTYNLAQQPATGIISYQTELMQSLELAILKNDTESITSILQHIQTYMSGEGTPSHIIRTIYLNTMSILFNYLERFQKDDVPSLHNIEFVFQHRYSLDQMLAIMNDAANKLCELLSLIVPSTRKTSTDNITELVDRHWSDPNLSLQFMADHFEMSPSNFSYHFKKAMGQNFKEYIDQYRIQQSLQILKSSQISIESIALKVGYMNSSSFIRSFKKIVGMTPGQYRDHIT